MKRDIAHIALIPRLRRHLHAAACVLALTLPLSACLSDYFFKPDFTLDAKTADADLQKEIEAFFKKEVRAVPPPADDESRADESAYAARQLQARLEKKFHAEGYYDARITLTEGDEPFTATFTATPGAQYTITAVTVDPPALRQQFAEAAAHLTDLAGSPLAAQPVLDAQADFYKALQKDTCFYTLSLDHEAVIDRNAKTASLAFTAAAGPPATFGAVSFTGNTSVKPSYLRKLVPWKEGDCFSRNKIESMRAELFKTSLFSGADFTLPDAPAADGTADIVINLTERAHRTITAGLTYYSDEGPGLSAGWQHRNFFGGAETLAADAKLSANIQSLSTTLTTPFFLRRDQSLSARASLKNETSDAYDTYGVETGLSLKRKFSSRVTGTTGVTLGVTRITDNATLQEDTFGLVSFPQTLTYDSRNDALDPVEGWYIDGRIEPFFNVLGTAVPFVKAQATVSTYLPLKKDTTTLALRAKAGAINGADLTDVPATQRFYAGGANSVRGFAYQSIGPISNGEPTGGRGVVEMSAEVRHKFTETIGAVAFVDAGSISEEGFPTGSELAVGAGVGLRYYTGIGPLRFDVATPVTDSGKDDGNIQFYLSIGQAF